MSSEKRTEREAILERVRALMAKTPDRGCTEAEAQSAAELANRLLAAYDIDITELSVHEQPVIHTKIEVPLDHIVMRALQNIAKFTDTKPWYDTSRAQRTMTFNFFGFEADAEVAIYLTLVFQRAVDRESREFPAMNIRFARASGHERRAMMSSFQAGMVSRMNERLLEMKSGRDFSYQERHGGNALVRLKMPVIEQEFLKLGIHLVPGSAPGGGDPIDGSSFAKGRAAGNNVALSQGIRHYGERGGLLE